MLDFLDFSPFSNSLNFQVSVEYDNLTGFLKTAQYLRVKGLTEEGSANTTTTPGMTINAIFHSFLNVYNVP